MNNTEVKLNLKWVSNVIGDEWKQWKLGDTVKIDAQTGTGKTFFIFGNEEDEGLVDKDKHGRLIYICNRTELKRSIKRDLCRKYNVDLKEYHKVDDEGNLIRNKDGRFIEDTSKLDAMCSFNDGNIIITSYHAIQFAELDKIYLGENGFDLGDFKYIVLDECQYFFIDAFNTKTYLSYNKIVKEKYHNSIKIFISATMDELDKYIDKNVEKHNKNAFGTAISKVWNYTTGRDYSYIKHVLYLRKRNDIGILIKNYYSKEINENNKWVVFVSSKKFGKETEGFLNNNNIKATFICSSTSDKIKRETIDAKGDLNCKVLITTKCLDNGININDKNVNNIAIFANDKITFMQELGRKRVKIEEAQQITLVIPISNKGIFQGLVNGEQAKIDDKKLYDEDRPKFELKYNNYPEKVQNDIFYSETIGENINQWKLNALGYKRTLNDKKLHEDIFNKLQRNKLAFVKEQLKWLGLQDKFDKLKIIEELTDKSEVETLQEYLDTIVGERLFKEEQQELSNLIIKELTTIGNNVDYRTKLLKPSSIETLLREQLKLPYVVSKPKVEGKGENRGKRYIIISKIKIE